MITDGQDRSIKKSHSLEQDGSWPSSCLVRPKAVLDVQRLAFFHDGVPRRRFETAHTDLVDILTAAFDRGIRVEIRLPIPTAASYGLGDHEIIGSYDVFDHLRFRSHFGSSSCSTASASLLWAPSNRACALLLAQSVHISPCLSRVWIGWAPSLLAASLLLLFVGKKFSWLYYWFGG